MSLDSVSREAYAAAAGRLEALAADGRPLGAVADEILAVAGLLAAQPQLRRALADPSRPGADRAGLLQGILQGKISADAAELVHSLVNGHWPSANALLNAMERLGVEALLAGAQAAGELADVEDELFRFGQVVDGTVALAAALGSSTAPVAQRAELVRGLLEGKAKPATIRLVTVALQGFGGRSFAGSLTRLVELAAQRRGREIAYVTVASPLSDAEESRLANRLAEIYGRPVEVKVTVVPEILGGASIRIGDDLYDGTVRRRLAETRAALTGK